MINNKYLEKIINTSNGFIDTAQRAFWLLGALDYMNGHQTTGDALCPMVLPTTVALDLGSHYRQGHNFAMQLSCDLCLH